MRAKCFSEEDKRLMVERIRENQTSLQNKQFRREQAVEALKDPQTWGYCMTLGMHNLADKWPGSFQIHYYLRLQFHRLADAVASHGTWILHYLCDVFNCLLCQEDRTKPDSYGALRCSVSKIHPVMIQSNLHSAGAV
jgi:hypothetical protein